MMENYDNEEGGGSTIYLRQPLQDNPADAAASTNVQQSFIFGAGQFYQSTERQHQQARQLDNNENNYENNDDDQILNMMAPARVQTQWSMVARHWVLSTLFLPLYILAVVTHTWKHSPQQLSKIAGTFILFASIVVYALLWALFGVTIASASSIRAIFPIQEVWFIFFLYTMCCWAESMLKNTHIQFSASDEATTRELKRENDIENVRERGTFQTTQGEPWSVARYLNFILESSTPTPMKMFTTRLLSVVVSLLYTGGILGLHIYLLQSATSAATANETATNHDASTYFYVVVVSILQGVFCFVIVYPLGQVALRLSMRAKVSRLFYESASYSQAEYAFRLVNLENIRAWQTIRDTLLRRYAFPTLYVDVVISAAFAIWVPLVAVGALEFLFQLTVTPLALNTAILALIILIHLLVCVMTASDVQEVLSNTEILRWQEYHFLVSPDKTRDVVEVQKLTHILQRLGELIQQGRDSAVVFQVWGLPLNRGMATFLGGVLVTLASSIVVRLGKGAFPPL
jgi:hypothetical protein